MSNKSQLILLATKEVDIKAISSRGGDKIIVGLHYTLQE